MDGENSAKTIVYNMKMDSKKGDTKKEHKKICKSNEMKSKKDLKLGFKLLMLVSSGNEHYIFNSLLHRTINCTKREMKNKTKSITYTKIQKK